MSMEEKSSPPGGGAARCVMLCPRRLRGVPPADIAGELAGRGALIECTSDAMQAMAALVELERSLVRGEHRDPMLLVLVEPGELTMIDELVAGCARYAPRAVVYRYEANAPKRLSRYAAGPSIAPGANGPEPGALPFQPRGEASRAPRGDAPASPPFGTGGLVSWAGLAAPRPGPRSSPRPAPSAPLRLADAPPEHPAQRRPDARSEPARNGKEPANGRAQLSEDELRMLLADPLNGHGSPDEAADSGGRR